MVSDDDAMRAANREEFEREMYDPDRQITPRFSVEFVETVLGETTWSKQREVLAAIPNHKRVAVPSAFGRVYVAPAGTPLNKQGAWTHLGNTSAGTHNMAGVMDLRAWSLTTEDVERLTRGLRSFSATLSMTMRSVRASLLKVFAPEVWRRLQHQQRYHRREDPAVSVMHAAYDRRRRARRRRNRR